MVSENGGVDWAALGEGWERIRDDYRALESACKASGYPLHMRWRWAEGWPNGGFWTPPFYRVPTMCRAVFGSPATQ